MQTCSDGAKKTVGEEIGVHGRKIAVKVNEGRKVDATKLDGKSNVWKKGARSNVIYLERLLAINGHLCHRAQHFCFSWAPQPRSRYTNG